MGVIIKLAKAVTLCTGAVTVVGIGYIACQFYKHFETENTPLHLDNVIQETFYWEIADYWIVNIIGPAGRNLRVARAVAPTCIEFQRFAGHSYVSITGHPDDIRTVLIYLKGLVRYKDDAEEYMMWVPKYSVGFIVGPNGDALRLMTNMTGATIFVGKDESDGFNGPPDHSKIIIVGNDEQISMAISRIENDIKNAEAYYKHNLIPFRDLTFTPIEQKAVCKKKQGFNSGRRYYYS